MSADDSTVVNDLQLRSQSVALIVIATILATFSVYWLRPVLVPLVVAFFIVSGVNPILKLLQQRLGVNQLVAAAITFMVGLGAVIVFGMVLWASIADLAQNSDAYLKRVEQIINSVESYSARFLPVQEVSTTPSADAKKSTISDPSAFIDSLLRHGISVVSQSLISLVSTSMVVLIYIFFLLIGTPADYGKSETIRQLDTQIRSYLSMKTVISLVTGVAFGGALAIFGVPMAITFGVLAFLLNFIPNIGPILASLLPIPLIVLDPSGSLIWMLSVIAITVTIQVVSGNVIEPKLMGDSSDLHPITILVALMFWGMMWGIVGMFLATPITAAIKILIQRFESTKSIAALMAGRFSAEAPATAKA